MRTRGIGAGGKIAVAVACLVGIACAASAGWIGSVAACWCGMTLVLAWHRIAPAVGITALTPAAIYGLAALAGLGGSDPEDVVVVTSFRLSVVALGCAIVGITCALVWVAGRSSLLEQPQDR